MGPPALGFWRWEQGQKPIFSIASVRPHRAPLRPKDCSPWAGQFSFQRWFKKSAGHGVRHRLISRTAVPVVWHGSRRFKTSQIDWLVPEQFWRRSAIVELRNLGPVTSYSLATFGAPENRPILRRMPIRWYWLLRLFDCCCSRPSGRREPCQPQAQRRGTVPAPLAAHTVWASAAPAHSVRVPPKPELDQLARSFPRICVTWICLPAWYHSSVRLAAKTLTRPIVGAQTAYVRSRHVVPEVTHNSNGMRPMETGLDAETG